MWCDTRNTGIEAMRRFALKRTVGKVAALAAAYALVLNVILSSLLIASISPTAAAAGQILCVNSTSADAARDDAGKGGQGRTIHCPLCVAHHVTGALPPPEISLGRVSVVSVVTVRAFEARLVARVRSHDHQSRAPPALI